MKLSILPHAWFSEINLMTELQDFQFTYQTTRKFYFIWFIKSLHHFLMLKLQYFGYVMRRADSFEKTLMLEKIEGGRRRGWQDEMVAWHHQLDGHEFEWSPGVGDGQGSLVCCSPWGHKESDTTERLNWAFYEDKINSWSVNLTK